MSDHAARERFAALVRRPVAEIDLLLGGLLIAQEEHPAFSVEDAVARVGRWVERLAGLLSPGADEHNLLYAADRFFHGELEFLGQPLPATYEDNVLLDAALTRRRGEPAVVGLLQRELLSRACGLEPVGVVHTRGLYLALGGGRDLLFLDPARPGRVFLRRELLREIEARVESPAVPLRMVDKRNWLGLLLRKLRVYHLGRGDYAGDLRAVERLVVVYPDDARYRRDRGVLYERLGRPMAAITDLEDYLTMRPLAKDAPLVRQRLERLHRRGTA
jgi:regulator of sirC expression with transglutaminase-like and TPR domain